MQKMSTFNIFKYYYLKIIYSILNPTIRTVFLLYLGMQSLFSQNASVTVSMKLGGVTNYKYGCTDCWEAGNNEYTSNITAWPHNDTLTYLGKSGCLTCDRDGDCTYGMDVFLFTQTGTFDSIKAIWEYFENNTGDRCLYEKQWAADDNCYSRIFNHYNFRLLSAPSNGVYSEQTYIKYQFRNFPCVLDPELVPFAKVTYKTTWKYAGSENQIFPTCSNQSAVFNSGTIPSWSAYLYAGVSYNFNTCSSASGEDTYMRIYGSDGHTEVASNNNGCGSASSVVFTPTSNGYYYIEVSHADRSFTESSGTLSYSLNSTNNQTCSTAKVISAGTHYDYNTFCSSQDAPAQTCGQSANEHKDIWFKYKASSTGTLVINNSSSYNSRISVYSGSCGSLSLQSCAYVDSYLGGTNSLTLSVCKNTNYFISVGGTYSGIGAGSLSLSLTPVNTLPTITCPSNINLFNSTGICGRNYNYTAPVGTDNCLGAVTTQIAGLSSGSTFPIGITTNTFRVIDSDGSSAQCSFTVNVIDNEAPSITCPPSITINKCSAVSFNYPSPIVNDNCGAENVTIQQTAGLASGSSFPLGVTTNTFRALDGRPNVSSNCSFTITVNQSAPLSISCPNNKVVDANSLNCYKTIVNYSIPQVDGSPECGLQLSLIEGKMPGSEFPLGNTKITWEVAATDGSYATARCSFTVTVRDRQAPIINCPSNISTFTPAGTCQSMVTYSSPTKSDNCFDASFTTLVQIEGKASGDLYPIGTTINTFKATDLSGNTATCSFSVQVMDPEPPVITCPDNIELNLAADECSVLVHYSTPMGTDNCTGSNTEQTQGLPSGSLFFANTTTNTFVVTDAGGMSASCSFTVKIINANPPIISCPENIIVPGAFGANPCSALVTYISPTGIDLCEAVNTERIAGLPSGSEFPQGETTITYVATDESGQSATCSFMVSVGSCNQAPVARCKNLEVSAGELCIANISPEDANDGSFDPEMDELTYSIAPQGPYDLGDHTLTFISRDANGLEDECIFILRVVDHTAPEPPILPDVIMENCNATPTAPTTTDLCMGTITGTTSHSFPITNLGTTTVTWVFDDGNGNQSTATQRIIVEDHVPPIPPELEEIHLDECGGTPMIPVAYDACSGMINGVSNVPFPITTQGTHLVNWTFDDGHGNISTVFQNVVVDDITAPLVPNLPDVVLGECGGTPEIPMATDNCSGPVQGVSDLNFPITEQGITHVNWTFDDLHGNPVTRLQRFIIQDNTNPTINCPEDIIVSGIQGSMPCSALVEYDEPNAEDNCGAITLERTSGLPSGALFNEGTTLISYRVTDQSGYSATCSFNVVVTTCNTAPVAQCKNLSVDADNNCSAHILPIQMDGGSFDPDGQILNYSMSPEGPFDLGIHEVTITVIDPFGLTDHCVAWLTVIDHLPPVAPQLTDVNVGECSGTPAVPTAMDACAGIIYGTTLTSFPIESQGTTVVTWMFDDGNGNISTANQNVIVEDVTSPTFNCPGNQIRNTDPSKCSYLSKTAEFNPMYVNDNCNVVYMNYTLTGATNGSGPTLAYVNFNHGLTNVSWTVSDIAGNASTCNFTVGVNKKGDVSLPGAYSILANKEIKLKGNVVESGGLGLFNANKKVILEQSTLITNVNSFVKSPIIEIKSGSSVTNQYTGQVPKSYKPGFELNDNPGNNKLTIADNSGMIVVNQNNYGDVEIGKNVTILFSGHPVVFLNDLKLKEGAQLQFNQNTFLVINKQVDLETDVVINQSEQQYVKIFAEEKVKIGRGCIINADIQSLKELQCEKSESNNWTYMKGQFIADKVFADEYVHWSWNLNYCQEEIDALTRVDEPLTQKYFKDTEVSVLSKQEGVMGMSIYPNPVSDVLTLMVKCELAQEEHAVLSFLNTEGRVIRRVYVKLMADKVQQFQFDLSRFDSGLYFIQLECSGMKKTRKLTVVR